VWDRYEGLETRNQAQDQKNSLGKKASESIVRDKEKEKTIKTQSTGGAGAERKTGKRRKEESSHNGGLNERRQREV